MQSQTFRINLKGAIQMTTKQEARKAGIHSPDHLDAAIYAALDTSPLVDNPLKDLNKGDVVNSDPWELLALNRQGPGQPI